MPTFDALRGEYAELWASASISGARAGAVKVMANKVIRNRERYEAIGAGLGIPWYLIGVLHGRESSCNFACHLHNGDPLTARTRRVPAGRPMSGKPVFSWEESARDALTMKGLHRISDWPIERVLFEAERYNGWGYRSPGRPHSPYLWAGTNHYEAGKYIRDHVFDPSFVDPQSGCAAVLKELEETVPDIFGEAESASVAIEAPKAGVEPAEAHKSAHDELKQESWLYSIKRRILELLGYGTGAGTIGFMGSDDKSFDPVSAAHSLMSFAKLYGFRIAVAVFAIVVAVELTQFIQREKKIGGGAQ